jgi:hypothetical protein
MASSALAPYSVMEIAPSTCRLGGGDGDESVVLYAGGVFLIPFLAKGCVCVLGDCPTLALPTHPHLLGSILSDGDCTINMEMGRGRRHGGGGRSMLSVGTC